MTEATVSHVEAGEPVGARRPDEDHGVFLLRQMLRIRQFEERCVELYSHSLIRGFLHLGIGEEACAVGIMEALSREDAVVATYREHGHALARGIGMRSVMAELEGKIEGCSRGARRLDASVRRGHSLLRRQCHRRGWPSPRGGARPR